MSQESSDPGMTAPPAPVPNHGPVPNPAPKANPPAKRAMMAAESLQTAQGLRPNLTRPLANLGNLINVFNMAGNLANVRKFLAIIPDVRAYIDAISTGDDAKAEELAAKISTTIGTDTRLAQLLTVFTTAMGLWHQVSGLLGNLSGLLGGTAAPATAPAAAPGGLTPLRLPLTANHLPDLAASVDFLENACQQRIAENVSYPLTVEEIWHVAKVFEAVPLNAA